MWTWSEQLRNTISKNDDNIYLVNGNHIWIGYPKFVDGNNLTFSNRNEMLCYLHLIKNPDELSLHNSVYCDDRKLCDMCGQSKHGTFYYFRFNNYSIRRCRTCHEDKNNQDYYINNGGHVDLVTSTPNYAIDVTFIRGDNIIFLYRYITPKSYLELNNVLIKSWYMNMNRVGSCGCCQRHLTYVNFRCKSCYDFSYHMSGLSKILPISSIIETDIFNQILFYYANSADVPLTMKGILAVKNPSKRVILLKEEEIIENLYFSDVDYDESCDDSTEHYESVC